MKIAIIEKQNYINVKHTPVPKIDAEKVLVEVSFCGICGSDIAAYKGSGHKKYPYSSGHEFCGVIKEKGESVLDLEINQRVVINPNLGCGECEFCKINKPNLCINLKSREIKSNGGFAEYVSLDYRMCHKLPDEISDEVAPFIEPLSCGMYAVEALFAKPGENIAVFGAGIMGLLTTLVLKSKGANILIIEPSNSRRESIKNLLGISSVMTPSEFSNSKIELDGAIDCSGNAKAIAQSIKKLKKKGRLVLAGLVLNIDNSGISLVDVITKELDIRGVWLNPFMFKKAIKFTLENINIISSLEIEKFQLDNIDEALKKATDPNIHKILIVCKKRKRKKT